MTTHKTVRRIPVQRPVRVERRNRSSERRTTTHRGWGEPIPTIWSDSDQDDFPSLRVPRLPDSRWFELEIHTSFAIIRHPRQSFPTYSAEMRAAMRAFDRDIERIRNRFITPPDPELGQDLWRKHYITGPDGKPLFRLKMDVQGFDPSEVSVETKENEITISAKKATSSANSSSSREFKQKLTLPTTIDQERISCIMSDDDILTVEAPVTGSEVSKVNVNVPGRPDLTFYKIAVASSGDLKPTGEYGLTLDSTDPSSPIMRVEVPVGSDWKPDQLTVSVQGNLLTISGKQTAVKIPRDFTASYKIPGSVNISSIQAQLIDKVLVVKGKMLALVSSSG